LVASLALLSVLTASAPAGAGAIALLDVGSYRKRELPATAGAGEWLAVCRGDAATELKKVRVDITSRPGERTTREVASPDCPYALALLRSPALHTGKLETIQDDQGAFTAGGIHYVVRRDAPEPEPEARCGVRRVHLVLTAGDTRQVLLTADFCTVFSLRWVGDLDGDAKPDLLVAENLDSGTTILHLFLSAKAPRGTLVAPAASIRHGS
jgi:hypothetical protein